MSSNRFRAFCLLATLYIQSKKKRKTEYQPVYVNDSELKHL